MGKNTKLQKKPGVIIPFALSSEYYFSKGLKYHQQRDYQKAKKFLERARLLSPDEPLILFRLAIVCTEMGEFSESNQILHELLEKSRGEMTECHYYLANNYAHLGMFKEAYHHAVTYLELDEDLIFAEDAEDLLDLLRLEDEELAGEFYRQDDLIAKNERARELLQAGRLTEVVDLLESLVQDFPEYWSAYNNLALAYFYLGEKKKADAILNHILEKNPGNLHALCNKLIFAYYNRDFAAVRFYRERLVKVKPMLVEQQYKLGATLALTGEFEVAYGLLKKLYRQGFYGEGPFFYWLALSAYYSGREREAKKHWEKVVEYEPEKAGQEPWNGGPSPSKEKDRQLSVIQKSIQSKHLEERLLGLFLASLSDQKEEILADYRAGDGLEKQYVQWLLGRGTGGTAMEGVHEAAEYLHLFHHPLDRRSMGIFLLWFSLAVELEKDSVPIKNGKAYAAAVEYIWGKLHNERISQDLVARQYNLSVSTLRKYVKMINQYLQ